jgi:hypothetical protein
MATENSAAEILRALNTLEQGILRARRLAGRPLPPDREPAPLPGKQRAVVAEFLDALHNLPQYLRELLGHEPEGLPPFVIERAFETFDDLMHQPVES